MADKALFRDRLERIQQQVMEKTRLSSEKHEEGEREIESAELVTGDLSAPLSVEQAGEELVSYLPDYVGDLIREYGRESGRPIWQILLSYAMICYEQAQTFVPYVLPQWETGGRANTPKMCRNCKGSFTSRWPDAQVCCNACSAGKGGHSDGCQLKEKVLIASS